MTEQPRTRIAHVHLDPLGGVSGDMFIGALLDAWPEAQPGLLTAIRAAGLPTDWQLSLDHAHDGALTGSRFTIRPPASGKSQPTGRFRGIVAMLEAAPLEAAVQERAVAILTLLAEVEAEVHGIAVDDVEFHEIADWDSVADVVGAAYLIDWLGAESWSVAPLPLGRGRVETRHGPLPIPAPATAKLLQGLPVFDDGLGGERVTPTGAAILRHLLPAEAPPQAAHVLAGEGTGFGTRRLPGIANALRVLGFAASPTSRRTERVAVIAFEVDDQTPEDLAVGLDNLRALGGVLDVVQAPVFGKKGRMLASVRLLARPETVDAVIDACFHETATIGLRWEVVDRIVLPRREIDAGGRVKLVERPGGGRSAKADIDDVAGDAGGYAGRAARRFAAESRALDNGADG